MQRRTRLRLLIALAGAAVATLAPPLVHLRVACTVPDSEACVWGKSYLPLTVALYLLFVGVPVGLLLYWIAGKLLSRD